MRLGRLLTGLLVLGLPHCSGKSADDPAQGRGGASDCSSCALWQLCENNQCNDDCTRVPLDSTDPAPWGCGKSNSIRVACGPDVVPPSDWECMDLTPPGVEDFDQYCCGGSVPP